MPGLSRKQGATNLFPSNASCDADRGMEPTLATRCSHTATRYRLHRGAPTRVLSAPLWCGLWCDPRLTGEHRQAPSSPRDDHGMRETGPWSRAGRPRCRWAPARRRKSGIFRNAAKGHGGRASSRRKNPPSRKTHPHEAGRTSAYTGLSHGSLSSPGESVDCRASCGARIKCGRYARRDERITASPDAFCIRLFAAQIVLQLHP